MSEYIDRDRLLKVLEHNFCGLGGADVMRPRREMQPAADAAPVRHGKNITEMHFSDEIICSICGFDGVGFSSYDPVEDICIEYECRYCPNCGARMDGEEKG